MKKPMKTAMNIISLMLLSAFSLSALAHTGHGESSLFAHDLDHALWVVGGVAVIAMVFFVLRQRQ
jgi:acyl-CoA thioesterase